MRFQFGVDPGDCCTWGFCGFMLDSEMSLLDFPGLEFAGHGDQDGCAYVLSS